MNFTNFEKLFQARMMLFQDMSAQAPFTNVEVDLALKLLREEFLCLVLSFAIHEIPEEMTEDEDDKGQFSAVSPTLTASTRTFP